MLQEFVQCSRNFHLPPRCPILQWAFDTRMADFASLEFRSTVAFVLDGVPHHVAGAWHPSKKTAQRDAAERSLNLFIGRWGEQLLHSEFAEAPMPAAFAEAGTCDSHIVGNEIQILDWFCCRTPVCADEPPEWSLIWENEQCRALVEVSLFKIPHKFSGCPCESAEVARACTARRVLWYLQCPGFEDVFEPDACAVAAAARDVPAPPSHWVVDTGEGESSMKESASLLTRVHSRLKKALAQQLGPAQSVWEWSYEGSSCDSALGWPTPCRATARIPAMSREFTGSWSQGQREAQFDACAYVAAFLDSEGIALDVESELSDPSSLLHDDEGSVGFDRGEHRLGGIPPAENDAAGKGSRIFD